LTYVWRDDTGTTFIANITARELSVLRVPSTPLPLLALERVEETVEKVQLSCVRSAISEAMTPLPLIAAIKAYSIAVEPDSF
jgi:hypothetical protein